MRNIRPPNRVVGGRGRGKAACPCASWRIVVEQNDPKSDGPLIALFSQRMTTTAIGSVVDELSQRLVARMQATQRARPLTPVVVRTMACDECRSWAHGESEERLRHVLRAFGFDDSCRLSNNCVDGVRILPTLTYSLLHDQVVGRAMAYFEEHLRLAPFDLATAPTSKGECGICWGDGEGLVELPCRHCFGARCLRRWLACHRTCPMCRFEIDVCASGRERALGGRESGV